MNKINNILWANISKWTVMTAIYCLYVEYICTWKQIFSPIAYTHSSFSTDSVLRIHLNKCENRFFIRRTTDVSRDLSSGRLLWTMKQILSISKFQWLDDTIKLNNTMQIDWSNKYWIVINTAITDTRRILILFYCCCLHWKKFSVEPF